MLNKTIRGGEVGEDQRGPPRLREHSEKSTKDANH